MRVTAAQKLVIELINGHKETPRGGKRIDLTTQQASKIRKGVPEHRTPWGIVDTEKGKVRWYVFDGYKLLYEVVSNEPNARERILQKQQEKAIDHLTTTIGGLKLEAWPITQEQKDRTLEYWKSLTKKPKQTQKHYPSGKEGPITTTTYVITAYRYWQHYTPTDKERITKEDEGILFWHEGKYCTYELKEEIILTLETDDELYAQTIRKKAEEWRIGHMVTAMTLHKQEAGKQEQVQHLQYKRVGTARESRARAWQIVDHIDTSREVIQYANTGKDY